MAVPAAIIGAVVAVGGAVMQYQQTKAQTKILEWEAKEQQRAAKLEYTQNELDRTSRLRKALAANAVNAAVAGVSVTEGTPANIDEMNQKNYELDVSGAKSQYLALNDALGMKSASAKATRSLSGYTSLLGAAGGLANTYTNYKVATNT